MNSLLRISPLLFLSGFCALIYQIAWMRQFSLMFGGTTAATAAVLAVFMAGLGIGNLWLGKLADRTQNPLRIYAVLETVIAGYAILSVWLFALLQVAYVYLGGQEQLGSLGASTVRLLLAVVALAIPTIAMGGTLPIAARYVTRPGDERRQSLAVLYGMNTLGAVLGPTACAFILLESLGVSYTIWLAGTLNLFVAAIAGFWAFRSRSTSIDSAALSTEPADPSRESSPVITATKSTEPRSKPPAKRRRKNELSPRASSDHESAKSLSESVIQSSEKISPSFIYIAATIVGFAFFTMELVWYRVLAPLLGGSTYTFAVILSVALAGIGLGAALYPVLSRVFRPSLYTLALTILVEALLIGLPFAMGDSFAEFTLRLREQSQSFTGLVSGWFLACFVAVMPAAIIAGLQFPLLIALLGKGDQKIGVQVGRTFALNTCGAIVGSMLGGFILLPSLSAPIAWIFVLMLLVALGLVTVLLASRQRVSIPALCSNGLIALLTVWMAIQPGPTAYWRHSGIGVGRGPQVRGDLQTQIAAFNESVIWESEGREASVALINTGNGLSIEVNGKSDGNAVTDAGTQIMLGVLGALLHPDPKDALMIGLGTGESGGWLADAESIERVDIIEIEPSMIEVARRCSDANRDVLDNPKVEIILNDAREQLLTTNRQYDLIISEPSNPYRIGVANLFTKEFYQAVKNRLRQDGLFVQWLQAYEVDRTSIAMVFETIRSTFPQVEVWTGQRGDLLLVCSEVAGEDRYVDFERRLENALIAEAIRCAWGDNSLEGVLAHYLAGMQTVDRFRDVHPTAPVTDNRNLLEYSMARSVGLKVEPQVHVIRKLSLELDDWLPPLATQCDDELVQDQWYYWHGEIESLKLDHSRQARQSAMESFPDLPDRTIELWSDQARSPQLLQEMTVLGQSYAVFGKPEALPLIEKIRLVDPITADFIMADYLFVTGDLDGCVPLLEKSFLAIRETPWVNASAVSDGLMIVGLLHETRPDLSAKLIPLISEPFAVHFLDNRRMETIAKTR